MGFFDTATTVDLLMWCKRELVLLEAEIACRYHHPYTSVAEELKNQQETADLELCFDALAALIAVYNRRLENMAATS